MSGEEVETLIRDALTSFSVDCVDFLKCGQENSLFIVEDQSMDGDAIFERLDKEISMCYLSRRYSLFM